MRRGNRLRDTLLLVLLSSGAQGAEPTTASPSDTRGPHHAIETGTCEAQATDYITHHTPATCSTDAPIEITITTSKRDDIHNDNRATPVALAPTTGDEHEAALADAAGPPFMSFEDWKEEMLKRTGQDPQELRSRKATEQTNPGDRRIADDSGTAWGDEEEIALDFGEYTQPEASSYDQGRDETDRRGEEQPRDAAIAYDHGKGFLHRSKDAGKTCKERFSYSSFDAGATILKTGSGTKNPKALLVENKDSYMLLECGRENKFVIVELSDDILLDTVVIANFEFFSSMIRHFRISVSDRYPVKVDKWKELGMFEARNSRDIQAFLVENPQIWARYVRFEFLTHYGNEFYCPVSLIRIHGTRMLDSWKEADGPPGEDASEEDDREARQCEEALAESSATDVLEAAATQESHTTGSDSAPSENILTSMDLFAIFAATCPALPTQLASVEPGNAKYNATPTGSKEATPSRPPTGYSPEPLASQGNATLSEQPAATPGSSARGSPSQPTPDQPRNTVNTQATSDRALSDHKPPENSSSKSPQSSNASKNSQSGNSGARTRGTPTSHVAAASPTVQEGFFNSITKRLVQVETNLTLSMKYIEDQSRHVQEAMQRMEQKHSQRISLELDALNKTLSSELQTMREQYEQLWQSTVLALESQREQTEQDAVALSARLNLLADEVVFQKRMAIAQAVLLLSCLFLVIFSRGVPLPYLNYPQHQSEMNTFSARRVSALAGQGQATTSTRSSIDQRLPSVRLMTPESMHDTNGNDIDDAQFEGHQGSERLSSPYHEAHARFYRPPSPSASRDQAKDDYEYHEIVTEGAATTRLPASDQHNSRKPLPALPEHPLSP